MLQGPHYTQLPLIVVGVRRMQETRDALLWFGVTAFPDALRRVDLPSGVYTAGAHVFPRYRAELVMPRLCREYGDEYDGRRHDDDAADDAACPASLTFDGAIGETGAPHEPHERTTRR